MLLLILPDGHVRRLVEKDVGGLQHRVGKESDRRALAVLARLLLELRHAPDIAAVRGAHQRHGGGGSLYLILRRRDRVR